MHKSLIFLPFLLVACGSPEPEATVSVPVGPKVVNLYTHRHYDTDKELFAAFTAKTGIEVKVVQAGDDELMARLEAEGAKSPCDLFITADAGRLGLAKSRGLLQPTSSEVLAANIPWNLRDPEGYWFGLTMRARAVAYNKDKVKADAIKTYDDLTKPQWKGRLLVRSSENVYNQSLMAAMIDHQGVEAATKWAKGIVTNMARDPKGGDTDQMLAIGEGLGDIAIVNSYYAGKLLASYDSDKQKAKAVIALAFPVFQANAAGGAPVIGTHVNVSGGGVARHAPHKAEAIALLEFLSDSEAQGRFAEGNKEYPVKAGVAMAKELEAFGAFTMDSLNLEALGRLNSDAVKALDAAGWRSSGMNEITPRRFQLWTRWSGVIVGVLAVVLALPLLVVVSSPVHTAAKDWEHVAQNILPSYAWETVLLLFGVLALGLLIAVPTAWFVSCFAFPGRRFFRWALVMPLALPTYISAYAYAGLLGPTGTLTNALDASFGFRPDIVGLPGLCFVLAFVLSPYIHLPARAAFAHGLRRPLDAARVLGASPWRRFRSIALPLARPAIAGGALLMAMETLNDYGAVKYYGVRTLTTGIFRSWGGLYDLGSALRLCVVLLGMIALLMWIERRAQRNIPRTTDQVPIPPVRLKAVHAWGITLWCSLIVLLGAGLPMYKIVGDVLIEFGVQEWSDTLPAFGNTLFVAFLSAICTLVVGILFTFRDRYYRRSRFAIRVAGLGYAIPGAVIAISVMALAGAVDRKDLFEAALIGSVGILIYAFIVRFLAVALQPMSGNLQQQPRSYDEAARLSGATPWQAFRRVNLPLLRPALLSAALLVSIDVIKELPLTLILRPFNFETLSTRTYGLASIEQLQQASWPALLIVICGLVPVFILERMMSSKNT